MTRRAEDAKAAHQIVLIRDLRQQAAELAAVEAAKTLNQCNDLCTAAQQVLEQDQARWALVIQAAPVDLRAAVAWQWSIARAEAQLREAEDNRQSALSAKAQADERLFRANLQFDHAKDLAKKAKIKAARADEDAKLAELTGQMRAS